MREQAERKQYSVLMDAKACTGVKQLAEYTGEYGLHALPQSAEAALASLTTMNQHGISVCVIDTVDGLVPSIDTDLPVGESHFNAQYRMLTAANNCIFKPGALNNNLYVLVCHTSRDLRGMPSRPPLNSKFARLFHSDITSYIHLSTKHVHERYGRLAWKIVEVSVKKPGYREVFLGSFKTKLYIKGFSREFSLLEKLVKSKAVHKASNVYRHNGDIVFYSVKDACNKIKDQYDYWYDVAYKAIHEDKGNGI